jgi:hypothetical protein
LVLVEVKDIMKWDMIIDLGVSLYSSWIWELGDSINEYLSCLNTLRQSIKNNINNIIKKEKRKIFFFSKELYILLICIISLSISSFY